MPPMRENKAKHKLQNGGVVTCVSGHNSPDMIDFLGQFGYDSVWMEGEHGPVDYGEIPNLTRAADLWDMAALARVNTHESGFLYRCLDLGAQGLVVPHVNSAEEARAIVDGAKHHPIGKRGNYSGRQGYGVDGYVNKVNDETMIVAMIEEVIAVKNLSEMLKVDHIDVFFVGHGDLSQSMGYLGQSGHPEVVEAANKAIDQIVSAGRVAGVVANDGNVEDYIKRGVRFLMNGWPAWVAAGANGYLKKVATASA